MPENVKDIIKSKYDFPDEHIELQDSYGKQYRIIFLTLPTIEQVCFRIKCQALHIQYKNLQIS